MHFVWRTAWKDFQRHRRSPAEFALWFGLPIVVGALLVASAGGRSGPRPQAHVLVVDEDQSFLSGFLVAGLSQEAAGSFVRAERVTLAAGRARLDNNQASALLIIPAGFGEAVLRETPCTLRLLTNPSQRILPGIVEESLRIFADAVFYLHRVAGEDLRALAQGPGSGRLTFPDAQIGALSVRANQLAARIGTWLSPMRVQLETTTDAKPQGPTPGFALLFLPGLLFMSLLFMSQGLSEDLWRERSQKTLRRIVVAPHPLWEFLAGKVLYGCILMGCTAAIALAIGFVYFDLAARRLPLAVMWATFAGSILLLGMMTLQLHVSSQRAGNIASMSIIFPLMMLGGSFFPFTAMPHWMASIGRLTPNGWAVVQLQAILSGAVRTPALALAGAGLLALGSLLFVLCARRLQRGFAQG